MLSRRHIISLLGMGLVFICLAPLPAVETFLPESELPKDVMPVASTRYSFDKDSPGKPPTSFDPVVLESTAAPRWFVKAMPGSPSQPNGLTLSGQVSGSQTAMLLLKDVPRARGEVGVRFRTLSTEDEQLSGIVYHYQDAQNYYLLASSTRDDMCILYRIKQGKRKEITSNATLIAPFKWHELRLVFTENTYAALVNGEAVLGGKDKALPGGQVGLFVAGNSLVAFDDFEVSK